MLSESKRTYAITKFREIELEVHAANGVKHFHEDSDNTNLLNSADAVAPILRTALVINWPEKSMKKRYERFRILYPQIDSLASLQAVIDQEDPLVFCKKYLDINANPAKPGENPKYLLLKTLTNAFLKYQSSSGLNTEIDAIRDWAERIDVSNLRNDPIAKLKGVGIGTVENIRLNLGLPVVKPDRHVISAVKEVLNVNVGSNEYTLLAKSLGLDPRYFDYILFEYGKLTTAQQP